MVSTVRVDRLDRADRVDRADRAFCSVLVYITHSDHPTSKQIGKKLT